MPRTRGAPERCCAVSDQFVRSGRREPFAFEDAEALRRGKKLGEALGRPEVGGIGGRAGGPGGMLGILQFRWQRADELVIGRLRQQGRLPADKQIGALLGNHLLHRFP